MITRKVDKSDHLAGFIYNWVKKIGQQIDELRVISWQQGDSSGLPENIKVTHLKTNQNKLVKLINFKKAVWKNLKQVDGLFCHQMPEYTLVAGPMAKILRKKVVTWYAHGSVTFKLKLVEKIANTIVSSSKKGFRLDSKKLVITGQGIDIQSFAPDPDQNKSDELQLITVGRISPTKDYESMIKAVDVLVDNGLTNLKLKIIGEAGLGSQANYFENLKEMVEKMNLQDKVSFLGAIPNIEIPKYLKQSDIFLNFSATGSLDKAILEAMSCGCVPFTCNEAFKEILPPELIVKKDDPKMLAEKIKWLKNLPEEEISKLKENLRQEIVKNHNLDNLVKKIVEQFK